MAADPITTAAIVAAGVSALSPAAQEFAKKLFGPLADELGKAIANPVGEWRARRAARVLTRGMEILDELEIEPAAPSPKLLIPLLEAASLEDNEGLVEHWATLLANAAAGSHGHPVHPRFPAILRELTPSDASVLHQFSTGFLPTEGEMEQLSLFHTMAGVTTDEMVFSATTLISLGLVELESDFRDTGQGNMELLGRTERRIRVSKFGRAFLNAVTARPRTR
ncbi:MAG TPA: Abi-alpha family protein [Longimicrobiaceae bacterium]|jgi:hypothetical protein